MATKRSARKRRAAEAGPGKAARRATGAKPEGPAKQTAARPKAPKRKAPVKPAAPRAKQQAPRAKQKALPAEQKAPPAEQKAPPAEQKAPAGPTRKAPAREAAIVHFEASWRRAGRGEWVEVRYEGSEVFSHREAGVFAPGTTTRLRAGLAELLAPHGFRIKRAG